jgi:hypothetical protein
VASLPDIPWWYWAATALALAAETVWPAAGFVAVALGVIQFVDFYARDGRIGALPVQVRIAFLGLLLAGLWPPLVAIHWLLLAGTMARVAFEYCALARTLALMPWNRTQPLTLGLVRRAYLTPPVQGSILAALSQPG